MDTERSRRGKNNRELVEVDWSRLQTGDTVYFKGAIGFLGPYKVVSSAEQVLMHKETGFRFHHFGRGLYA